MAEYTEQLTIAVSPALKTAIAVEAARQGRKPTAMARYTLERVYLKDEITVAQCLEELDAAKHADDWRITEIADTQIVIDGVGVNANLIIENRHGRRYGVTLGGDDWDYLQDNGEYVPVPVDPDPIPARQTAEEFLRGKVEAS